ncbi:aminoglycoside phosphotransferase family protein [Algibacillus agarilyticus]|uniref:aminoglycoside phosphotransferase family protein n=1 Tax=Algibacillus agarilyticus TaxID=2234133 RepID=UPI000DD092DF|nr:phosphotransferase [Algibacillus agarilyticus]
MLQDTRADSLFKWLNTVTTIQHENFKLISGDASFRRYFRCKTENQIFIAVDSPPQTEDNALFCALANTLAQCNVTVPAVISANINEGFLLLSDLGKTHLSDIITQQNAKALYTESLDELVKARGVNATTLGPIPAYDHKQVIFELSIFSEWLINTYLKITLTEAENNLIQTAFGFITAIFMQQPTHFVHRDYHSRNIMLTTTPEKQNQIAIIDFQGALIGPVMYDSVSLLRDCYIAWPQELVLQISEQHRLKYYSDIAPKNWQQGFDIVGIQRHIKAAGIFARLHERDNKPFYLNDIPRTLQYIVDVGQQYSELLEFANWLEKKILPKVKS